MTTSRSVPVYLRLRDGKVCSECIDRGFSRVLVNRCADGSLGKSAVLYAEAVVQRALSQLREARCDHRAERIHAQLGHAAAVSREKRLRSSPTASTPTRSAPSHETPNYVFTWVGYRPRKASRPCSRRTRRSPIAWMLVVAGTGPLEADLRARFRRRRFVGHLAGSSTGDGRSRSVGDRRSVELV